MDMGSLTVGRIGLLNKSSCLEALEEERVMVEMRLTKASNCLIKE